jgi:hypothetical protein
MNTLIRFALWPSLFLAHLLAVSLLAWHLLAQFSFAYPIGYKLLSLDKHIQEYAATNRYKKDFEFTRAQEHWDLFAQITTAVQHQGKGLETISYELPNGTNTPLMHVAEVTHLQDVANLIDVFYKVGIIGALIWLGLLYVAYRKKIQFPSISKILFGFCGGALLIATLVVAFGATKVFYWLHTQIFPEGHQWFFYYDESLMTTLMKAPDIFGFIGSLLAIVFVVFWLSSVWVMANLLRRQTIQESSQPAIKQDIDKITKKSIQKKRKK